MPEREGLGEGMSPCRRPCVTAGPERIWEPCSVPNGSETGASSGEEKVCEKDEGFGMEKKGDTGRTKSISEELPVNVRNFHIF